MEFPGKPAFYDYDATGVEEYKYSSHVGVSSSDREFFISFICARPYEQAKAVARIVIGESHMVELIAVLQTQLEQFRRRKKEGGGEGGNPPIRR